MCGYKNIYKRILNPFDGTQMHFYDVNVLNDIILFVFGVVFILVFNKMN